MLIPPTRSAAARGEGGFSLVELLVAILTGVIVTGVIFSVLEFSTTESTRISDVAQATQHGRITMTHIVNELHSACVMANFTPVEKESSESTLIFETGYGEEAELPSVATAKTGVRKEEILWSPTAKTLRDYTKLSTGFEGGNYTFSTAEKFTPEGGVLIGEDVSQNEPEKGKTEPIFRYFKYASKTTTGSTEAASTLEEIPLAKGTSLTSEQANTVAAVQVAFDTAPVDKKGSLGRSAELSSEVTFAFSAPNSEAKIVAGPCQ
jgi:hypothetical protein